MKFLVAIGAVITFLLLSLIITKRKKLYSDRFLILFLSFAFLNQLYLYLETTESFQSTDWMLLGKGWILLSPPLFFLYIYSVAWQRTLSGKYILLSLLPFLVYSLHFFYYHFFVFADHAVSIHHGVLYVNDKLSVSWLCFVILFLLIDPFFLVCFYMVLKNYKLRIRQSLSSLDRMLVGWLNTLFYLSVIIALILVPLGAATTSYGLVSTDFMQICMEIMVVVFYLVLGFYGFQQTNVFTNLDLALEAPVLLKSSYEKSGLTSTQLGQLQKDLVSVMETRKLYLQAGLTASELANELGISTNQLSQVLSQAQGQNFFDFVNGYRVSEVIRRMGDLANSHLTILGIALESGFNSKASFNAVFKKATGKTPTQYISSLKSSK